MMMYARVASVPLGEGHDVRDQSLIRNRGSGRSSGSQHCVHSQEIEMSSDGSPVRARIKGLYHFAYPCRDAEETRVFYEDLLGLPLVNCMRAERVPSGAECEPYSHLFFQMGDGSYVAFFDLGKNERPLPLPNTPDWVMHLALEVGSLEEVLAVKARLEAAGIPVKGVIDHDFIKSVYFFDPNGLRLEITARTEALGYVESAARAAHQQLREWLSYKRKRLGQ
jgi:catechol 2,3-dioxygenase-like lactoylglutathione lyase family enzyme